jgi:hypothetical protein
MFLTYLFGTNLQKKKAQNGATIEAVAASVFF